MCAEHQKRRRIGLLYTISSGFFSFSRTSILQYPTPTPTRSS
ncbi:Protein CBG25353 [Caenorhabditis briggsae]|uniref:Protein CBG25353 n=1 Tax=Caenorhabditis briggsae TaxID=6238 RepID=B6IIL7_CAEBR|nr:Protein CBG25353 [Caenorhabditis briggsae]CAR99747.1 Protein CBG25353 [Caenorhabditis briggsae]